MSSSGKVGKQAGILVVAVVIMGYLYNVLSGGESLDVDEIATEEEQYEEEEFEDIESTYREFLPASTTNEVVDHKYYTLSYSEKYEQAEWVAYETDLTRLSKNVERTDNFRQDRDISSGSATLDDYSGSGYDRGHLVPAGDMHFSRDAMSRSFLMSNISPQNRSFNRGVWRELEEQVRDWTRGYKHLYVVTGPVLTQRSKARIGDNDVAVPRSFYKVLLDYNKPELKAVGFVIPNEKSDKPLDYYAMSIDEVEELTGLDFFPNLPDDIEQKIERKYHVGRWPFDEERYRERIRLWNKL